MSAGFSIKYATIIELLNYDLPSFFELSGEEKRNHIKNLKHLIQPVVNRIADNEGTFYVYVNILRTCKVEELIELINIFPIPKFYPKIIYNNPLLSEDDRVYLALAGIS